MDFSARRWDPKGAMALVDGEVLYVNGFKVDVVDTTGAGDVFHGGFIYGLLQNWEVTEILQICQCRGRPQVP